MRCPLCEWQTTSPGGPPAADLLGPSPARLSVCARCGSLPEDRELIWFLKYVAKPDPGTKLLDIGPTAARLALAPRLFRELRYTAIDIVAPEGEGSFVPGQRFLVMDVTRLSFSDQAFPLVLAPYVLAEVRSDYMAMWELHRCLHNDGMAVLTEPLFAGKTERYGEWEGEAALLPEENRARPLAWAYGADFLERLEAAGFFVERLDLRAIAGPAAAEEYAFRPVPELILGFKYRASLLRFRERLGAPLGTT
jgi:hypothetical protein